MSKKPSIISEFKKFITKGNIIDMAVGVIVGGAFTAIVNSLSNNILRPVINWILALILGKDSLSEVFTFLQRVDKVDETGALVLDTNGRPIPDLAESIYIDWGAFVNAIINFLIIAVVLFAIVKFVNNFKKFNEEFVEGAKKSKLTLRELKENGVNVKDKAAVEAYLAEQDRLEEEREAKEKAEAEAKARADREINPTSEDLLKEIRDILKNK